MCLPVGNEHHLGILHCFRISVTPYDDRGGGIDIMASHSKPHMQQVKEAESLWAWNASAIAESGKIGTYNPTGSDLSSPS